MMSIDLAGEFKENQAQREHIDFFIVVDLIVLFRCDVHWCSASVRKLLRGERFIYVAFLPRTLQVFFN